MPMFKRFLNDENGATAIEYALIAILISVSLIAGSTLIGNELAETFGYIGMELSKTN